MELLCCCIYCVLYYVIIYFWCGRGLCDILIYGQLHAHAGEGVWEYQLCVYLLCTRRLSGFSLWVTPCLSMDHPDNAVLFASLGATHALGERVSEQSSEFSVESLTY